MGAFVVSGLVAVINGLVTGYLRRYVALLVVAVFGALLGESVALRGSLDYRFGDGLVEHLLLSLILASLIHAAVRLFVASLGPTAEPAVAAAWSETAGAAGQAPADGEPTAFTRLKAAWQANPLWKVYAAHALGLTVILSTFLAVISTGAYWWAQRHSDQRVLVDAARNAFNFQLTLFGVTAVLFILAPKLALFFNVFIAMPLTLATVVWNLYRVRRNKEGRYPLAFKVFKAPRAV
ncbi:MULTISPECIES: DUF4870 domain-containing protein [Pseudomonas]|uniref:DUF4870 domain-containing protein n=1 Tax=Pseudomonas TaxID=286 RepID=UPI00249BB1C6|nr:MULTISPECIES: DUF4870 domain-containing protein [Pseudomonas]